MANTCLRRCNLITVLVGVGGASQYKKLRNTENVLIIFN